MADHDDVLSDIGSADARMDDGHGGDGGSGDERDGGRGEREYRRRDRERTDGYGVRHASTRMRTPYERPHGEGHGSSSRAPRDRQSDPSCRIFVGNLSYETSWQDLKDFMRQAGEVVHADVLINAMGRSKGCGVVEFASADDAKKAMETLNDKELMGRPVFIREDRESDARFGMGSGGDRPRGRGGFGGGRGGGWGRESMGWGGPRGGGGGASAYSGDTTGRQLFIGNLPYIVSWQDIKDLFRDAGSVVRADVHQAPDGRPKGTGVVIFETEEDAKKAIETFNGYEWHGRKIEVREDKFAGSGPPPRSWGPPRGGGWGGWYGPSPYGPPPYGYGGGGYGYGGWGDWGDWGGAEYGSDPYYR